MSAPIIVGLDGSRRGDDALALGRMLARTCEAPVLLAAIASGARPSRDGASEAVEHARRALAGVTVAGTRVVRDPSSARGLARVAERDAGALVVIGASARGPAARLAPGGVLERLAHVAQCPVAVAPDGYWGNPRQQLRRVGVAYLPTPDGRRALAAAVPLARSAGARLRLLEAVPPGPAARRSRLAAEADLTSAAGGLHEEAVERRMLTGAPADALRRASEELDLLVCGSHARGPLGGLLWPSVSARVARDASCPVLIVPPGADPWEPALRLRSGPDAP